MVPPQELKKNEFNRSMRGYEPSEVDEHINFLTEKYTELYSQCDKYRKKLELIAERISEIKSEEEAIHKLAISNQKHCDSLLDDAKKRAAKIVSDANSRAEKIMESAANNVRTVYSSVMKKTEEQLKITDEKSNSLVLSARKRCADILNEFKKEINTQKAALVKVKDMSEQFNESLLFRYKEHLRLLNEARSPEINLDDFDTSELLDSLMMNIKTDAVNIAKQSPDIDYDYAAEIKKLEYGDVDEFDAEHYETSPDDEDDGDNEYNEYEEDDDETDIREVQEDDDGVKIYSGVARNEGRRTTPWAFDKNRTGTQTVGSDSAPTPDPQSARTPALEPIPEEVEEKPIATFDSEDFEGYGNGESSGSGKYYINNGMSDGGTGDAEYSDIDEYGEGEDSYDNQEYGEVREKKGLFGFLSKMKGKKAKHSKDYIDEDDDFGEDDEALDIFGSLDDDE